MHLDALTRAELERSARDRIALDSHATSLDLHAHRALVALDHERRPDYVHRRDPGVDRPFARPSWRDLDPRAAALQHELEAPGVVHARDHARARRELDRRPVVESERARTRDRLGRDGQPARIGEQRALDGARPRDKGDERGGRERETDRGRASPRTTVAGGHASACALPVPVEPVLVLVALEHRADRIGEPAHDAPRASAASTWTWAAWILRFAVASEQPVIAATSSSFSPSTCRSIHALRSSG